MPIRFAVCCKLSYNELAQKILAGCLPSKPLHSSCPSEEDAYIHSFTVPTAGRPVWIWLCSIAVPQDGVPCFAYVSFANQVRIKLPPIQ